jgi:hypothetical protein
VLDEMTCFHSAAFLGFYKEGPRPGGLGPVGSRGEAPIGAPEGFLQIYA